MSVNWHYFKQISKTAAAGKTKIPVTRAATTASSSDL
jgi:hypothetical protein